MREENLNWIRRNWTFFSILTLVVTGGWIIFSPPPDTSTGGRIPAPREGFMAPDFSLQDAQGQTVTLSELRGRPVLINLWASWCPPCKQEMPDMQAVYDSYSPRGFTILAVNTTFQDSQEAALSFVRERGLTFPILFDLDGAVSSKYQVRAMPTSIFVRPDGTVSRVVIGGPMSRALLQSEIERLFEEAD